jgi:hypothetical protein
VKEDKDQHLRVIEEDKDQYQIVWDRDQIEGQDQIGDQDHNHKEDQAGHQGEKEIEVEMLEDVTQVIKQDQESF